jgi:hypothetical protein
VGSARKEVLLPLLPPLALPAAAAAPHRRDFYTTGGYRWATLDHGLGQKFKSGRIFLASKYIYRPKTKWPNFGRNSKIPAEIQIPGFYSAEKARIADFSRDSIAPRMS